MKYILAALLGLLLAPAVFAEQRLPIPAEQTVPVIGSINQSTAAVIVDKIHELNRGTNTGPIYLVINSPGGDVLAGFQVIQAMQASRRPVYTVDVGFAASMAAYIHGYGAKRYMTPYAVLMYHEVSLSATDDTPLSHVAARYGFARRFERMANQQISAGSGISVAELEVREANEWWVFADEASNRHLVDGVFVVVDYPTGTGE